MMLDKPSLTLKRRLNAAPAKVYAAWTEPERLMGWWGPREDDEPVLAETDVRPGGRFRLVFRAADGEEFDVRGVYREVVPAERLVFSWAWRSTPERESLVTLTMRPDGDGTMLTLHHEQFFDETARDSHRMGWMAALDRLERQFS